MRGINVKTTENQYFHGTMENSRMVHGSKTIEDNDFYAFSIAFFMLTGTSISTKRTKAKSIGIKLYEVVLKRYFDGSVFRVNR